MTEAPGYDVVVSGGGPVGMGLAIELGQRGVRTLVIERYPEPQPIPKGQNLTQRTMEHIHFWGAESALRAARTIPASYGIGGLTAYGTLLGEHHYDWLQRELVRPFYFTANERLPQYATEAVLRARAAELPAIDIRYGWSVDDCTQDDAGVTVRAVARDGAAPPLAVRARYLVGCDGSRSVVRETSGISQTLSDHDRLMALLVFRSRRLSQLVERFPAKSFYNVLHPDLDGYWLFFGRVNLADQWFFHAPVPRSAVEGDYDFKAYVEAAVGAEIDFDLEHVGFWDLRFAIADDYRRGRVFVAGDAAHSHPPYGGYGINTGFEDARNLGWKLAATIQGWGGEGLLDSYHQERHGVFASTAHDFIARSIETDRDFLRAHDPARDAAAFERAWDARASGASGEVAAFEPNYEGSAIVPGTHGAGGTALGTHELRARPGHHLAPAALPGGGDVYDRLGAGFTLLDLAGGEGAGAVEAAAEALGVPLSVVALDAPALAERYAARLILVRPDHFVAWAGDEAGDPLALLAAAAGHHPPGQDEPRHADATIEGIDR